jgi:hypothetical protein
MTDAQTVPLSPATLPPPAAFDASVAATPEDALPHRWNPATRLGFRFAFCYFLLYCLCCGNATLWEAIPVVGGYISYYLWLPFGLAAQFLAQHLFHVQGIGAKIHGSGSGDKAIDWIAFAVMLSTAALATLLWTALDRKRPHYQTLAAWLRFTIRLTLGMGMVSYGFAKVFPMQMQTPLLPVLNEPLGNTSPMTMLWTLIGLNPLYEMVCGAAEVLAGALILFRRTALLGALLTAFVITNVVLYNMFFDVPVKLYAGHLLLLSVFVVLPDLQPMFAFFWQHRPAAPLGVWVPPARRRWFRIATAVIEIAFAVLVVGGNIYYTGQYWWKMRAAAHTASPLVGGWRIDAATLKGKPQPYLVAIDQSATELWVATVMSGDIRAGDGALYRAGLTLDAAKHTLQLQANGAKEATFAFAMPDTDHLLLTPTGKEADSVPAIRLTRIPVPATYPLLQRGFHWVNEWGLER